MCFFVLNADNGIIEDDGWIGLAEGLKANTSLKELILIECGIKSSEAVRIGRMLGKKYSLTKLVLDGNSKIGAKGWISIEEALESNTVLTELDLSGCQIFRFRKYWEDVGGIIMESKMEFGFKWQSRWRSTHH